MSLFSKLFSRDDKVSEESAGESAQAKTAGTPTDARKASAASSGNAAQKPSAEASVATEKNAVKTTPKGPAGQGTAAEGQGDSGGAKDGAQAGAKAPPLEAASGKGKKVGNKTLAYGRTDKVSPAQPLAAAPAPAPAGTPKATPAKPMPAAVPAAAGAPKAASAPQPSAATVVVQPTAAVLAQPAAATPPAAAPVATVGIPPLPGEQRDSTDAIDAALDALESKSQARHSVPGHAGDERALTETFAAVAQVHAQPLRELMFQLDLGRTPREWCSLARPVLRPLLEAAQQIGMLELVGALLAFDAALERAAADTAPTLSERSTETLKNVYQGLCRLLPAVFTVTTEAGGPGRQTVLLESLLLQIPELHRRSLAKLYAAGLSSLAQLSQASAEELAAVTGLEAPLAERLVAHVRSFEEARTRVAPSDVKSRAHERLRGVLERLRELQAEFEQAEREEQSDKKRAARRGREAALHELDLVLAEIGDLAVIEELKRCPVQQKIQRVSTYLKAVQASA